MTHEEYLKRFNDAKLNHERLENVVVIGTYINSKIKIKVKCEKDDYEWEVMPLSILQGHGCPKCAGRICTHEEFVERVKNCNPDIEVISEYKNNSTNVLVRCKKDNHEWSKKPSLLLAWSKCPKCVNRTKSHDKFVEELKQVNPNVEVIGEYVRASDKLKVKCKIDGYEWESSPNNLLKGRRCYKCYVASITKTHEEFLKDLQAVHPNIEPLEEYKGTTAKMRFRCKLDSHEWEITANRVLHGKGCPKCNGKKRSN